MTTERVDRCPTCGSVVRVISADDDLGGPAVSACYQPMQDEELRAAIERLKEMNVDLTASRNYWKGLYTGLRGQIEKFAKSLPSWQGIYYEARLSPEERKAT